VELLGIEPRSSDPPRAALISVETFQPLYTTAHNQCIIKSSGLTRLFGRSRTLPMDSLP